MRIVGTDTNQYAVVDAYYGREVVLYGPCWDMTECCRWVREQLGF
jgi:hypothetical protein